MHIKYKLTLRIKIKQRDVFRFQNTQKKEIVRNFKLIRESLLIDIKNTIERLNHKSLLNNKINDRL